ncbi:hypothetical protein C3L33_11183, partial [Rhododendron williamsianum]
MSEPNFEVTDINHHGSITHDEFKRPKIHSLSCSSAEAEGLEREDEADLKRLLMADVGDLPLVPPSADEGGVKAVDFNVGKSDRSGMKVTGKRKKQSEFLLQNAQHFESNTALCKVCTKDDTSYIVRFNFASHFVILFEFFDIVSFVLLSKTKNLLAFSQADREGYIAIIMPKPADWLKTKPMLLGIDEYKKLRELS